MTRTTGRRMASWVIAVAFMVIAALGSAGCGKVAGDGHVDPPTTQRAP